MAIPTFVVFGATFSATAEELFLEIEAVVATDLSWWYVAPVSGLLVFVLYIGLSRHGNVRLGKDEDQPEFSLLGTDRIGEVPHIQVNWTMALWGWWIAWAPFVGIFTARISRGRTIREFVLGVLLVPTLVSFFWFTVLGGIARRLELFEDGGLVDVLGEEEGDARVFFTFLESLPLTAVTSIAAVTAVFVSFVTPSNSGSLVIDMMTSAGHPDPPRGQRPFWAVSEGAVTAVLLLAGRRSTQRCPA